MPIHQLWQYQQKAEALQQETAPWIDASEVLPFVVRRWLHSAAAYVRQEDVVVADAWTPMYAMAEGIECAMIPSGVTAYQEQEADYLRLSGDIVTLDGEPVIIEVP